MSVFPKYERYKDSEAEWLGEVPQQWEVRRVKSIFRMVMEPAPKDNSEELLSIYTHIGVEPRKDLEEKGNKASTTDGYWRVKVGDMIVNKLLAWMGAIGLSKYEGVTSPAYDILRPFVPASGWYYHYLFRTKSCTSELKRHSRGIMDMRLRLYFDKFGDVLVPYPPIEEQDRIVSFLDQKTAEIDALIAKKQRQIELLDEQKAILINRAVTRGLNPNAKLKPSGIEWIGDIPEHWEVKKIKYLSQIFRGKFTHRPRNDPSLYDGPYPFVQTGDVARAGIEISSFSQTLNEKGLRVSTLVPKGTIAITIAANIGDVAILGFDACFPDSVVGFLPSNEIQRLFFFYILKGMKAHFLALAPKNTQHNLNVERVGGESLTVPPGSEQDEIIAYIETLDARTRLLVIEVNREIECLKSLRSTLIAHAVTGRIRV